MLCVFSASFFCAATAGASTLGPLSGSNFDASAFNVIALTGNFAPTSDVGGRVAVFGNYTGNGYQIDSQSNTVPDSYSENYSLIVNGSITTNPFTVGSGGAQSVWVGGTYTNNGTSVFNSSPTVVTPPTASDFNFASAQTYLDNLSTNTLANAGVAVTPGNNGTNYVVSPTGSGLFIYNVDASYFTNQNLGFQVTLVTGQSVIVNITGPGAANLTLSKGTVVVYNGNTVSANTTGGVPVMFNLPTATSLSTSNGSINGSILAPYATFSSPNQTVDGEVIVAAVNGLAETHDQFYDGLIPMTATPEPLTFLLVGGGLVAIGLMRAKRVR